MNIVDKTVSAGDRAIFDLEEFLSRPLYAHLAHNSELGPRQSPVWFHWDGRAVWIIGGTSFPANLKRDPRCALGIVDWDPRFDYAANGQESDLTMVRFTPETVVVRDQSYKPTRWARQEGLRRQPTPTEPGAPPDRRGM